MFSRMPVLSPGEVWLAGAGPGDPGHLTLFALAGLAQAETVVHDALVDPAVLALARPDAELIHAGKRGGRPSWQQDDITLTLIERAQAGRRVLRLKGGDPYVFGRGGEEALQLARHAIPFRVIPGITAGIGGLGAVAIPATMRGVNQAVVLATGHEDGARELDWAALARLGQPIVIYMGFTHLPQITAALLQAGMPPDTQAAAIAAATTPDEQVLVSTLDRLAGVVRSAGLATPVLVVIGAIVGLRAQLHALLPQALEGLRWPRAE